METVAGGGGAHAGDSSLVLGVVVHAHEPDDFPDERADAEGDHAEEHLVDDELAESAASVAGEAADSEGSEATEDEEGKYDDYHGLTLVEVLAQFEGLVMFFFATAAHL